MGDRERLSSKHAVVVAYVALFVAMGGTAVAASYVVSSNSQLGPATVSGSKPTSGKHDNIIDGTVNGADVANNSLGGADVNEAALGTVPNAAKLNGHNPAYYARVIPFSSRGASTEVTVATIDGLEITTACESAIGIHFYANSDSTLNLFHVDDLDHVYQDGAAIGSSSVESDYAQIGRRVEGHAIYRRNSDGAIVTITYHMYQPTCELTGTAVTTG
jgi:hypothetical protein